MASLNFRAPDVQRFGEIASPVQSDRDGVGGAGLLRLGGALASSAPASSSSEEGAGEESSTASDSDGGYTGNCGTPEEDLGQEWHTRLTSSGVAWEVPAVTECW